MEQLLIVEKADDLIFLEIIVKDLREQFDKISELICSIKENMPYLNLYEDKKNSLSELIKWKKFDEENLSFLNGKLVGIVIKVKFLFLIRDFQNKVKNKNKVESLLFK
jgi:hypothetical protein